MSTILGQSRSDSHARDALHWWETQMTQPLTVVRTTPAPSVSRADDASVHATARHSRRVALPLTMVIGIVLYVLLNVGDVLSTWIGLHTGLHEGNPLMSRLLATYGFSALIAYKVAVVVAVSAGVTKLSRSYRRVAMGTLIICNVLVGLAVLLNLLQTLTW